MPNPFRGWAFFLSKKVLSTGVGDRDKNIFGSRMNGSVESANMQNRQGKIIFEPIVKQN